MKNVFKKLLGLILCVGLVVGLLTVSVFADSNSSQGKRANKQGATRSKDGVMVISHIKDKIGALDDAATRANLTKLLQAYEDALASEKSALEAASSATQDRLDTQNKATSDARNALVSALSKAGIDIIDFRLNDEKNNSRQNVGNRGRGNGFALQVLDIEAIEKLIANVEINKQANLTQRLAAYKDALAAEITGSNNTALTEDEKKELNDAAITAAEKLIDALTNAGIQKSDYIHHTKNTDGSAPEAPLDQQGEALFPSDSSVSSTAKAGVVQGFINWLGSWLK